MLESKLRKAAQAIVKNNSLLICSGSGMAADCDVHMPNHEETFTATGERTIHQENLTNDKEKIPTFRGTQGLWREYPAFRKQLITFDNFVEESFFV
jgi:hypothetical protein